jgi:uncharacterized protein YggE
MWRLSLSVLLLASAPLFAQLESHTLTTSATRSIVLQPDQIVFGLSVSSTDTTSLDQIVGALSGLGITSANLVGVGTNYAPPTFQWNFTLAVPLSSMTTTIGSLSKLQQTIAQNNSGLTLTFMINGTQVSQQLQQSQTCSNADLVSDATAQAQKLAAAAGFTLGPIQNLANAPLSQPSLVATEIGYFANPFATFYFQPSVPTPVTCSLVVVFRLLL